MPTSAVVCIESCPKETDMTKFLCYDDASSDDVAVLWASVTSGECMYYVESSPVAYRCNPSLAQLNEALSQFNPRFYPRCSQSRRSCSDGICQGMSSPAIRHVFDKRLLCNQCFLRFFSNLYRVKTVEVPDGIPLTYNSADDSGGWFNEYIGDIMTLKGYVFGSPNAIQPEPDTI